jgi:hypothetical protein
MEMREQILNEIRRLATESGGETPGVRRFENQTGIRQSAWRGVYWARWNDAVIEAGLEPNAKTTRLEEHFFFVKLAEACHHFQKFPTAMELRMYSQRDPAFPNTKSITRHFRSLTNAPGQLIEWARTTGNDPRLIEILGSLSSTPQRAHSTPGK